MSKWNSSRVRRIAPILCALSVLLAPACVSSARYKAAVAERERLARENTDLLRALTEERVREQEAREALSGARPAGSPQTSSRPGQALGDRENTLSRLSVPIAPEGLSAPAPNITDEDVMSAAQGSQGPGSDAGILKVARSYSAAGKSREALDAYTSLIGDYPFSTLLPQAFLERGRLRLARGDRKGALEDFDTVSEAFPGSPQALEARRQGDLLRR